jgi:hypothetical protein
MMACFSGLFLIAGLFVDTSYATFESALFGLAFADFCSTIYGYSEGDGAVRDWRNNQGARQVADKKSYGMIDEPSPFESIDVWKQHLNELRSLRDVAVLKVKMIKNAEEMIARKRRE